MFKINKITEYLLYLFLFLLPLQTRWIWHQAKLNQYLWEYGSFSLYGTDILLGIILVLFICFYRRNALQCVSADKKILPIWWIIAFLELAVFISIFFAEDRGLAFYGWIKFLEGVTLFWLITKIKPNFKKIGIALGVAGVMQVILSLNQFFVQLVFENKWLGMASQNPQSLGVSVIEFGLERWMRAYGSFPHPNILGGFLAISIIFLLGVYLKNIVKLNEKWNLKLRKINIIILSVIALEAIGIFLSFSRSAWLALLIGIFLIFIFFRKNKRFLRLEIVKCAGIIFLVFLVLGFIFSDLVLARFDLNKRLEQKSLQERIIYNNQSFELIKNNWHKGVGVNNYTLAVYNKIDSKKESWFYQPAHNIYLLILSELGIFGFIVFVSLICYLVYMFVFFYYSSFPHSSSFRTFFSSFRAFFLSFRAFFLSFSRKRESILSINPVDSRFRGNDNKNGNNTKRKLTLQTKITFISFLIILIIGFFDHYLWSSHLGIILFWVVAGCYWQEIKKILS